MCKVDIHADDYALSMHGARDIIALLKEKKIDSISIMPNMRCFHDAMELLKNEGMLGACASVHLNFMEGKCCSNPSDITLLVDEDGYFKVTWGSLFFASFKGNTRRQLMLQLAQEIKMQIERVTACMPKDYQLRIDSHQHTHMIPVVRDALLLAIDERCRRGEKPVTFVRLSKEPLLPFIKHLDLRREYSLVNLIKNRLLWLLAFPMEKQLIKRKIDYELLWGLMLSGNMNAACIEELYSDMVEAAGKRGKNLEILFHPGSVLKSEISQENVQQGFVAFHLSDSRAREYRAVEKLKKD